MFYTHSIPRFLQKIFPGYVCSIPEKEKVLYISFDDGPTPEVTAEVLAILNLYKVQATFFCLGKNIEKHPETLRAVVAANHTIANHSYSHQNAWRMPVQTLLDEVLFTQKLLTEYQKDASKLFRPPYGKILPKQAKALRNKGFKLIMWEVLSGDFDRRLAPEKILKKTLQKARNGSIIVFHDSTKAQRNLLYVLPKALKYWTRAGYRFKRL